MLLWFACMAGAAGPEFEYQQGVALARQGRFEEARAHLLAGHRLSPGDARFPVELGGVAFRQKRYAEAARWLRRALRLNPGDAYTADFLGAVYFLEGNLDAALKYWNRAGKPRIAGVRVEPGLRVDPVLLDRAFAFAPGGVFQYSELLASRARVAGLGIFPAHAFRLHGREDGSFEMEFAARERNGFGGKWEAALSTLRGVFFETVHADYFNVGGSAVNITSLVRWDAQKRRVEAGVSGPLRGNPAYRYRFGFDTRDEDWDLRPARSSIGTLRLRRTAVSAGITSFRSGRWSWSSGGEFSHRDYAGGPDAPLTGFELKHTAQVASDLWRVPERRFESSVRLSSELARVWSAPSRTFERLQIAASARWLPRMKGEDYAMEGRLRAGKIFGQAPFDELFILGLERDNNLWMRAHIGTHEGRKGSAPMGRTYLLANWEFDKTIYANGLLTLKISPFLDTGKITPSPLGARTWLWDTGLQAKLQILGVGFTLIYGKDLRSGANTFYALTSR